MQKIVSLFQRNYEGDRLVRDEIVPGAEWVPAGEGEATRKWDGTACRVHGGVLYARYDAKTGRTPPEGFEPTQEPDPVTGHWPGWVPANRPEDRWIREAWENSGEPGDGTYEALGPKIGGNPEHLDRHELRGHGDVALPDAPRDYAGLRAYLDGGGIEGIVWHHPDGRMVKIKAGDFGVRR